MIKLFSKKNLLIFFLIILLVSLSVYFLPGYFEEVAKEKKIVDRVCQESFGDPLKRINEEADYVSVWYWKDFFKKPFQKNRSLGDYIPVFYWEIYSKASPLKSFVHLSQQYDACRLFLNKGYERDLAFKFVSEEDRQELLKSFDFSWTMNQIAISKNCDSSRIKLLLNQLSILGNDFKDKDIDKMCYLFNNNVSDEEIRDFCLDDEICFITIKADPSLIEEKHDLIDKRRFNFIWYLAAIKNNNKNICPDPVHIRLFQESFPRIPCQIYFIKNNSDYCDFIYNAIKQNSCKF